MDGQAVARSTPWERSFRYDAPVIGLTILMLIAGWAMKSIVEGVRTTYHDTQSGFSIQYPSSWTPRTRKGYSFSIYDLRTEEIYKPGLWIEEKTPPAQADARIQSLVTPLTIERGRQLFGYRVLNVTETKFSGMTAMQIEYAYVEMPSGSAAQSTLPMVIRAVDTLFLEHGTLYIITYAAPEGSLPEYAPVFEGILESLEFAY